jgi:hypothetical protein
MANPEQLRILKKGVFAWNKWRAKNRGVHIDLASAELSAAELGSTWAAVGRQSNSSSRLRMGNFDLRGADLSNTNLIYANLRGALLHGVDLRHAQLLHTNLAEATLVGANLTNAHLGRTIFAGTSLRDAIGLETCPHMGPSWLDFDTLAVSGLLPENFLRGCGLSNDFINYLPSFLNHPIQFYSCFISYSTKDEEFSRRLHSRMREANMRVWFAPEDLKGGKKLHEQLFDAIQIHDRLLIVLSEHSIQSEWVMTEIRKARETEKEEKRRKLFPIRLCDFETLCDWTCFDADTGKDLAVEVREYFIPDFSNWKDHDAFESAFARLKKDLEAENLKT